ncbi:hypothetical protein DRP77_09870 [Candidatus Poribacteria bacterium]|nr:MAG: hypothetical protein DRP77_09870 [Candidatus Poribacteria bacterium]
MFRVLLVEDDPEVRNVFKEALRMKGYEVVECSSAEEAWELLERGERFDLVVTDVLMPGMDGIELLRRIKTRFPGMGVVVITGHGSVEQAVEAMKAGASDYIQKPVDLNRLISAVEGVLVPARAAEGSRARISGLMSMAAMLHSLSGTTSLDELLKKIADFAFNNFSPKGVAIGLLDEEKEELEVRFVQGIPDLSEGERVKVEGAGVSESERRMLPATIRPEHRICLPLIVDSGLIGVIAMVYDQKPLLDQGTLQLMNLFAYQAAIAISNVKTRAELRRMVNELQRFEEGVKKLFGAVRMREVIKTSLEESARLVGAEISALALLPVRPELEEFAGIYVLTHEGVPEHIDREIRSKLEPVVSSFFGDEVSLKELTTIPMASNLAFGSFPERVEGFITALLIGGEGTVIGFISAMSEHEKFDWIDVRLLQMMGYDVAAAIQRAIATEEIRATTESAIRALARAVEKRDPPTLGHSERVARIAVLIGEELGFDQVRLEKLRVAGLLHDIGKIGVPDWILKKPGKLTEEEYAKIKEHPDIGASILEEVPQLREIIPWIRHHHERMDGKGYPAGLSDDQIPLEARILAVADAFDAMTSDRVYRPALPLEEVVRIMEEGKDKQWDGKLVDLLFKILSEGRIPPREGVKG